MLTVESLVLLLLIAALVVFWYESRRAAEICVQVCHRTCKELNLQFLDQTVALSGLGLGRNSRGRIAILRQFRFEFSTTGADRCHGRATMLGPRVESVQLDHPDGSTIITPHGTQRLN